MAPHGWLHTLHHWGLPRFTAHNCLPLHRRRFSKYDRLILMCLGKHNPNTNAALHAWANRCRCRLIISPTCTPGWSVNSGTISSSPRLWLMTVTSEPVSPLLLVPCVHRDPWKITLVQHLMKIQLSWVVWWADVVAVLRFQEKAHLNYSRTCGTLFSFVTIQRAALFTL